MGACLASVASVAERLKRPFWMHQVVEYVLGVALVAQGLRSPTPLVPASMGALVVLNAATARGPVGAFRLVGRAAHRVLDVVVIALLFAGALQPVIDVAASGRVVVAVIAGVLAFVWWQSSFAERVPRPPVSMDGGRSSEVGRMAGRIVGDGVSAVRRGAARRRR